MIPATVQTNNFMGSTALVDPNFELRNLLISGLPLDKVGPRLRNNARRAVCAGDVPRMQSVARVIVSELRRQGNLSPVATRRSTQAEKPAAATGYWHLRQ